MAISRRLTFQVLLHLEVVIELSLVLLGLRLDEEEQHGWSKTSQPHELDFHLIIIVAGVKLLGAGPK